MRRERRYPKDQDLRDVGLKLAIPSWVKEKYPETHFEYRWFAGSRTRMILADRKEWDVVEGVDKVPATDKDGRPADHILCVKRKDWYDEDRAHLEVERHKTEKQMLRGKVAAKGEDAGETLSNEFQYQEAAAQNRLS